MSWYKLLTEDSLKEGFGYSLICHKRGKEDAEDGLFEGFIRLRA